jgi:IS30 family transposase
MKNFKRLSLAEWQRMFEMQSRGSSVQEISLDLKRDRRGIKSALERYRLPWHHRERGPLYKALHSYEQALMKRGRSRKKGRLKNQFIRDFVEARLKEGLSPELIAGRLNKLHPEHSTNYESIYEWIFEERPDLKRYLLRAGKSNQGKPGGRAFKQRQPAAPKKSVEVRPAIVSERTRLGDKESDLIVSSRSDACLLVMVDRKSRQVRIKKLSNRLSETVKAALVAMLIKIPKEFRHTLTQDNGSEHALHAELERAVGMDVYFCHPYSAWERGTVENRNGLIRRWFPKGTDFNLLSDTQIQEVEDLINARPMVCLDFLTPDEFHNQEEERQMAA